MGKSKAVENAQRIFRDVDRKERKALTDAACAELMGILGQSGMEPKNVLFMTLSAAVVALLADGVIVPEEEEFVNDILGCYWSGGSDKLLAFVKGQNYDGAYAFIEGITKMGERIAVPFLRVMMGFAYSDDTLEVALYEKLDGLYENM